jgi:signal transduction histidine kinase
MTAAEGTASELRVLVLAPLGRDAEVTCAVLRSAEIECHACADVRELVREFAAGVGAIVLAPEALGAGDAATIHQLLGSQPPWSDVPVVLTIAERLGAADVRDRAGGVFNRPGAVTVLERPIRRLVTMQTMIRAALTARQRQYQIRDLIEQLRVNVERLDAEQDVRDRFVSLLAHDLRGPLSTATMAARLLVAHPERLQDRRDLALRIERSMVRADRMIQDLLDANSLRAGHRLTLDLQPCDLPEIASDVITDLSDADRERVVLNAPGRIEGVWAPDQLRRALWNLITNALKYGAPDAPVEVDLTHDASGVVASVHNSGPPIPPEEQARLFAPFGRARSAVGRTRGWGLGLALVRGCADAHGGSVGLSSTQEAGTTFTMRLPLDARPFQQLG